MARRLALLVNPSAGGGRACRRLPGVEAALRRLDLPFRTERTRSLEHARELARDACARSETVVALSGDGLVGALAGVVHERRGVLGVLPGGRGNDFARKLGIPANAVAACAVLATGVERELDLGQVDGRPFVGVASLGIDSDVQDLAAVSRVPGGAVYLVCTLRALAAWRPAAFRVSADGGEEQAFTGYSVAAGNSGIFGGGMRLMPDAELDDGLLDVLLSLDEPKRGYLRNVARVFRGTHLRDGHARLLRARELRVAADRPFTVYADGDPIAQLPATFTVVPRAVRVLCPA